MKLPTPESASDVEVRLLCEDLVTHYVEDVVLGFNLCPWAHRSVREKLLRIEPIFGDFSEHTAIEKRALEVVTVFMNTGPEVELLLLPLPRFLGSRLAMDGLLRVFRTTLERAGCETEFALAAFHPAAELDQRTPETMIPFFRRTPLPLLQAVRTGVLSAVSSRSEQGTAFVDPTELLAKLAQPPRQTLRAEIAEANARTLAAKGEYALEAIFDDLRRKAVEGLSALESPPLDRSAWSPR